MIHSSRGQSSGIHPVSIGESSFPVAAVVLLLQLFQRHVVSIHLDFAHSRLLRSLKIQSPAKKIDENVESAGICQRRNHGRVTVGALKRKSIWTEPDFRQVFSRGDFSSVFNVLLFEYFATCCIPCFFRKQTAAKPQAAFQINFYRLERYSLRLNFE